jgi:hypothetical protein
LDDKNIYLGHESIYLDDKTIYFGHESIYLDDAFIDPDNASVK